MSMITWLKQRLTQRPMQEQGKHASVRHCRDCGAVVPAGAGMCPRCHSMDVEDGPPNAQQQKAEAAHGRI
jgi:ribosomal protein L40E